MYSSSRKKFSNIQIHSRQQQPERNEYHRIYHTPADVHNAVYEGGSVRVAAAEVPAYERWGPVGLWNKFSSHVCHLFIYCDISHENQTKKRFLIGVVALCVGDIPI